MHSSPAVFKSILADIHRFSIDIWQSRLERVLKRPHLRGAFIVRFLNRDFSQYPSSFRLHLCGLRLLTRITYVSKFIGIRALAALM
ncbi:hypothetical protein B2M27_09500 [Kluyvera intermedia]|uniref:Uncharacterized protein n=1 Tax=Kluyvera intermedia TaxID=61648 RepID=A0ABX3UG82_KLUIN|nr:hypothetical protein B2M27_09500 [Kluyvera intermedia]